MTNLIICDDDGLSRRMLRQVFDVTGDVDVVGEAADGRAAVAVAARSRPDVALVDIGLPDIDGVTVTRRLRGLPSPPEVLILTVFDSDDVVDAALRAGALGYLLKSAPMESLVNSVRAVASGGAVLAPTVTRRLLDAHVARQSPPSGRPLPEVLTERERQVLVHVARGLSNAEIALTLYLGEATVRTYVSRILGKLGLRSRTQAAALAHSEGWVTVVPATGSGGRPPSDVRRSPGAPTLAG